MGKQSCRQDVSLEDVRALPPSAKLVYKTLQYHGDLTQKELAEATRLAPRTVRYATNKLTDADVVTSRINIHDARQHIYAVTSELQTDDAGEKRNRGSK